ncbi:MULTISPECIES: hypothetical protein [Ralstonia solanacearum species complex]|uniref:hypothetical protein n=1 Tax=Ralstonia solanacearum species complex TaxID=3116862 RepID=UPI0008F83E24|nr:MULTISPECIES: hypothetical protein [Ralstonia solanacearum species complex]OIN68625.1 hypothetical protein BL248_23580 [Ralstonia solanacearum]MDO3514966.1 hypothetical protein [Ralstonia pseudosolanacearum]MDO3539760.1 hypothetical protein [Ralstonia pseudosolanacearum]MDO3608386.1 hypothetical protein [Ralstonia pseudosolanacearum]MDO3613872.1 hypothetical protein [Ralstonia pseudosolanacearum]
MEIASFSGEREPCEIEFTQGVPGTLCVRSARFGALSFTDDNLFAAMSAYRRRLEQDGYLLLCNGARRDAYPSQMILEMGGGRKIYLLQPGRQTSRQDLVDIFGAATIEQVCTVAEQRASYDAWIRSLR